MNNKHLTFEERSIIEDLPNKGEKIHKIAQKLGRPDSSIKTPKILFIEYVKFFKIHLPAYQSCALV